MKGAKQTTLRDQGAVSGIGVHSGSPVPNPERGRRATASVMSILYKSLNKNEFTAITAGE